MVADAAYLSKRLVDHLRVSELSEFAPIATIFHILPFYFGGPALCAIWGTRGTLVPLPESLPGDIWSGNGCTVSGSTCLGPFGVDVIQKAPDSVGMGSFPEKCAAENLAIRMTHPPREQ